MQSKLYWPYWLLLSMICMIPIINIAECSWGVPGNGQYHIQTDEGPERYFRYQTDNGQFRKEKRLQDGTVIGTEAWIDAAGFLRQTDYIADKNGYRILKAKTVFVGQGRQIDDAIKSTKSVPAQSGVLVDGSNGLKGRANSVSPTIGNKHATTDGYVYSTTTPVSVTTANRADDGKLNYLSPADAAKLEPSTPNLGFDHYPDEIPRQRYQQSQPHQPIVHIHPNSQPIDEYGNSIADNYAQQIGTTTTLRPQSPSAPSISMEPPYEDSFRRRTRPIVSTTPTPISTNDVSSTGYDYRPTAAPFAPQPSSTTQAYNNANGYYSTTPNPHFDVNNLGSGAGAAAGADGLLPPTPATYQRQRLRPQDYSNAISYGVPAPASEHEPYDGIGITQNGFRYFLPRHYHEEEQIDNKKAGSYGYVDPFGIRRVVYYNASPERGFVHRNNNRYVGLGGTPYDPVAA